MTTATTDKVHTAIRSEILADIDSASPNAARGIFTAQETARILNVSDMTLRRWRAKGYGPKAVKVGAHFRYTRTSIAEFMSR